jgi:hypothetical protein
VSSYCYICVLILLYMCIRVLRCSGNVRGANAGMQQVPPLTKICVLILLYMCLICPYFSIICPLIGRDSLCLVCSKGQHLPPASSIVASIATAKMNASLCPEKSYKSATTRASTRKTARPATRKPREPQVIPRKSFRTRHRLGGAVKTSLVP